MKLFGRDPSVEDWRFVGRWAYGSAWLATDRATARELVHARFIGTSEAATAAAMAAGRGDANRLALVSAIARLPEALRTGHGPYAAIVNRAIDETVERVMQDGARLRKTAETERTTYAPRFHMDGFLGAMNEVGAHRSVLLKEVLGQLEDALALAKDTCPTLRSLALFIHSLLGVDSHESTSTFDGLGENDAALTRMGMWLVADVALTSRRAARYAKAWTAVGRASGDALSKTLAGLTSGAMQSNNVADAITSDPWALIVALAMTSEAEHASALLDYGVQAQQEHRNRASREIRRWSTTVLRAEDLERRVGIAVLAPYEEREGYRDCPMVSDADLMTAWHWGTMAERAAAALGRAIDGSVASELSKRNAAVKNARSALESVKASHEAMVEKAKRELDEALRQGGAALRQENEAGSQRGCMYGMGAGCSVMATYMTVCVLAGTAGLVGKLAPLVVAIAALPMGAAVIVQVGSSLRRVAMSTEEVKRREIAQEKFARAKVAAQEATSAALEKGRRALDEAEAKLATFERQVGPGVKGAA